MISINTNVGSLNAQRSLLQNSIGLNEAMTRLSTGRRINSAADDSAGLAISNRMTAQINGLNQAVRNTNDGISLAKTAEGALDETTQLLQEMRTLSVQSSNGTLSQRDRESLDAKFQEFVSEINRIAGNTTFNGINLLDGTFNGDIQVGANANQTINITIGNADIGSLMELADATTAEQSVAGIAGVAINAAHADDASTLRTIDMAGVEVVEGATYKVTVGADEFSYVAQAADDLDAIVSGLATAINGGASYTSAVDGTTSTQINISAGAGTAAIGVEGTQTVDVAAGTVGDILTSGNAQSQIDKIDAAIGNVDSIRGELGAKQNRFKSTISNLNNIMENMSSAKSRILDADVAQETSNMMKYSILQQAGVSILAQANQLPSLALSLLR